MTPSNVSIVKTLLDDAILVTKVNINNVIQQLPCVRADIQLREATYRVYRHFLDALNDDCVHKVTRSMGEFLATSTIGKFREMQSTIATLVDLLEAETVAVGTINKCSRQAPCNHNGPLLALVSTSRVRMYEAYMLSFRAHQLLANVLHIDAA